MNYFSFVDDVKWDPEDPIHIEAFYRYRCGIELIDYGLHQYRKVPAMYVVNADSKSKRASEWDTDSDSSYSTSFLDS